MTNFFKVPVSQEANKKRLEEKLKFIKNILDKTAYTLKEKQILLEGINLKNITEDFNAYGERSQEFLAIKDFVKEINGRNDIYSALYKDIPLSRNLKFSAKDKLDANSLYELVLCTKIIDEKKLTECLFSSLQQTLAKQIVKEKKREFESIVLNADNEVTSEWNFSKTVYSGHFYYFKKTYTIEFFVETLLKEISAVSESSIPASLTDGQMGVLREIGFWIFEIVLAANLFRERYSYVKTVNVYEISKSKVSNLIPYQIVGNSGQLPMLTRPVPWKRINEIPQNGGYLSIKLYGIKALSTDMRVSVPQQTIDAMNKLQCTAFKVESLHLKAIKEKPTFFFRSLLEMNKADNLRSYLDAFLKEDRSTKKCLKMESFEDFEKKIPVSDYKIYHAVNKKLMVMNIFMKRDVTVKMLSDLFFWIQKKKGYMGYGTKTAFKKDPGYSFVKKFCFSNIKPFEHVKEDYIEFVQKPIFFKYMKEREKLYKYYNALVDKFYYFVEVLSICDIYKDVNKIYFPTKIDSRGRIYYLGSILNPQHDKFSRSFLTLYEQKNSKKQASKEEDFSTIKSIKNGDQGPFFRELLKQKRMRNTSFRLCFLDVVSSGMQIVASICGDKQGILSTNVFESPKLKNPDLYRLCLSRMKKVNSRLRKDIEKRIITDSIKYETHNFSTHDRNKELYELFKEYFPKHIFQEEYKFFYSGGNEELFLTGLIGKEYRLPSKTINFFKSYADEILQKGVHLNLLLHFFITFYLESINRKIIKFHVMPNIYGEKNRSRCARMCLEAKSLLKQSEVGQVLNIFLKKIFPLNEQKEKFISYCIKIINQNFLLSLEKLYPRLCKTSKIAEEVGKMRAKLKLPINLSFKVDSKNFRFKYNFLLKYKYFSESKREIKIKQLKRCETSESGYIRETVSYTLKTPKDKLDLNKAKMGRSFCANIIQKIDACLLAFVTHRSKVNRVNFYAMHDCVVTTPENAKMMKKFYFEGLTEVIFLNDILRQIAENNCVTQYENKYMDILKRELISFNEEHHSFYKKHRALKMNNDILKP